MTEKNAFDYDLIVIGSGASGSAAAITAAKSGKSVAVVEAKIFGGDSPNYGDIPTKSLLHAANLYNESRQGSKFGIRSATLGYNYPSINAWKDLAVKRTGVNNKRYYENKNIATFSGIARFLSPNEISVNRRHLSAKKFIIATGSKYETPKIPGLEQVNYFTPHTILDISKPPKSLAIIGGDELGVEIAQLLSSFGTKIFIIEPGDRLLENYDKEVGESLEKLFKDREVITYVKSSPVLITKDGLRKRITFKRGKIDRSLSADEILITTNRFANTDLGLENANVDYNLDGVKINRYLQTSNPHIFAIGDVTGKYKTSQSALLEGQVAAHNLFSRNKIVPSYKGMPEVVFSNPEVAKAGKTEKECKKAGIEISTAISPLHVIARSNTSDFKNGFVKIIVNKKGIIIGASVVSPHASEAIHELSLAIHCGLTAADIASAPHAFLSWSEAIKAAAGKLV